MKRIHYNSAGKTRIIISFIILGMLISMRLVAQHDQGCEYYLSNGLPKNLEVNNDKPQSYRMITDYFNKDIFGNFFNKYRVEGTYNRGLDNGTVTWENVSVSESMSQYSDFGPGTPLTYMQNFAYKPDEDMMLSESFQDFPATE